MVASKETAEEQLLRMIEGPQGPPISSEEGSVSSSRGSLKRDFFQWAGDLKRRLTGLPRRRAGMDPFLWKLKVANRLLWFVLIGLGIYLVLELFGTPVKHPSAVPSTTAGSDVFLPEERPRSPLRPLPEFLASFAGFNPFTGVVAGQSLADLKRASKNRLEEMVKGLTLVGIDRGANPAAIIEGTDPAKTYIVSVGDQIKGMQVREIGPDGVTLFYEGEKYVLR